MKAGFAADCRGDAIKSETVTPLLAEALVEANAKCASLNKTVKLLGTAENPGPYIMGNYPKATVMFSCT